MDRIAQISVRTSSFPPGFIRSAAQVIERSLRLVWAADRIAHAVSYGRWPDPSDLETIGAPPTACSPRFPSKSSSAGDRS